MKPTIRIEMDYSTFTQYQPHEYNAFIEADKLSLCDKEIFIKHAIEELTDKLIDIKMERKQFDNGAKIASHKLINRV